MVREPAVKLRAAAILALILACTFPPPRSIVDFEMPEAERHAITEAERAWIRAGADPRDVNNVLWVYTDLPPGLCGSAAPRTRTIKLARNRCTGSLYVVALHELGHVLTGGEHSDDPQDVMHWRILDQVDLTPADRARLAR